MTDLPYDVETDDRPRLGLIVLQADETIEDEFRHHFDPATVRLNVSRVRSGAELTQDSITAMEGDLPAAASLFPEGARFDVVGYACTSGSRLIGSDRVARLVQSGCECQSVTNPLDAAFAALHALGAARIGIVSPYTEDMAQDLHAGFEQAGFDVVSALSFGEEKEASVARISTASVVRSVLHITQGTDLDAVFLSCTNLRTKDAMDQLGRKIDIPVLSSNSVLAWHMGRLAGLDAHG